MSMKTLYRMLKKTFGASNYELERPLPKGKKQKSHERRIKQKNHKTICGIKSKSYLIDDNDESKKGKGIKKMCHKSKT